jgi:hypothetical protein
MRFEWDENKNLLNQKKHKLSFATASLVFDDPFALSRKDRFEDGEERWQTIGVIGAVLVILVAHTVGFEEDEVIRIISARKATRAERRKYEEA